LTESLLPTLFIHGPTRFVNSLPRLLSTVLRTRTIRFKGDHFSRGDNFVRFIGDTFARGGSFHTFRLIRPDQSEHAMSYRGPHYMGGKVISWHRHLFFLQKALIVSIVVIFKIITTIAKAVAKAIVVEVVVVEILAVV